MCKTKLLPESKLPANPALQTIGRGKKCRVNTVKAKGEAFFV